MDKFWWRLAWGLCLSQLSLAQIDLNITCRYAGVFHVEKNGRYSISKTEAADLCKAFNSTLPTMTEMEAALSIGFETCRYGFIEGHVVIPRIHPNSICAANNTGVYILTSNTSQYDTYCFNASAPPGEDCTSVTHLPNAFEGPITITIVNRDGTRYTQTGEYRTNPEDIYPSNPTDDDVSSGSSSERSTSGGYSIFHTHLPTAYPTQDQDSPGASDNPENPPITTPAHDSHPDQRMTTQSQEDSSWTYFFDPISHPMGRGHQTERWMDMDSSHSTTLQPSADPNTHSVEELDRTGPLSVTTQQSNTQSFSTSHGDWEEDKDHPVTSTPTSSSKDDRTDGRGGRRSGHLPEDSATSVESYTSRSPATKEPRTLIPVTPAKTGVPEVTEVNIAGDSDSNVDRFFSVVAVVMAEMMMAVALGLLVLAFQRMLFSEDQDSPVHPSGRSHTTHGSESAGHTSGSQEGGPNTTSGPKRKPQIPEWLIILASLLALALILAVCIAVNSRRRCGQKKKLVINNGNGAVEERKASGLNGEASKSQEMVHLVNKESSVTCDQYMTADETRNLQNVDMKIGV
ncbi:CD44 antigen isoform X10 [Prionailurus viverrinus]|uniref:CD44 antigen isoform X10 n=1 Tax=Prionailurus viverrinus TaxID=61388 RepID=UPI001FF4378B|nr:CD44 antigen isoform X10 [Prionailurus viverrinus]